MFEHPSSSTFKFNPVRYEQNHKLTKIGGTFHEFVRKSEEMHKLRPWERAYDADFHGDARSFEDMVERCYDGYNAKAIGEQRRKISEMFQNDRPMDEMRVSGEALDVPTFLSGDPKCFWEGSSEVRKARVHLCYGANALSNVDANQFINHGGAVATLCDLIADQAETRITAYLSAIDVFDGRACLSILVKDYGESVDIPRIGATTHPSFYRRLGFAWFKAYGKSIGKKWDFNGGSASRTGKDRHAAISNEEFSEWVRIDKDEIVVELPASNLSAFTSEAKAAKWVERSIATITEGLRNGQKHFTLWD